MKTLYAFLWLFAVSLFFPITAQNEINLEELLERHSQPYLGSINDVFSEQELEVLQNHFNELNENDSSNSILAVRRGESTRGNTPVSVVQLDPETLGITNLGVSDILEFEGAGFVRNNPNEGSVIIDNLRNVHIRQIGSTSTSFQGTIDINTIPAAAITGIEVLTNGEIYAVATNGVDNSGLFLIDDENWTASPVGGNNGLILPINLMRDGEDNLFVLDVDDDGVYGVDKQTGVASFIGDAGFDANFGQGACYDEVAEKILLTAYNASIGDSELRELNPMTGLTTSLGTITPGNQDQFGWLGMYNTEDLGITVSSFNNFKYYPNPLTNKLTISSDKTINSIVIYNILGQVVHKQSVQTTQKTINLESLSSGQYLLRVTINNEHENFKLIKI